MLQKYEKNMRLILSRQKMPFYAVLKPPGLYIACQMRIFVPELPKGLNFMAEHNVLGRWGEQAACELLVSKGYAIRERNWRSGHYEIDLIAQKGTRIVFVEVKTRKTGGSDPLIAFDTKKQRRLARAADTYLRLLGLGMAYQFDFIGIVGDAHQYSIEHIEDVYIDLFNIRGRSARL